MKEIRIIEGLPGQVELVVNNHLTVGWALHGTLFHRKTENNNTIAVQGLVRKKKKNQK